jgi:hypothetical protein
MKNEDDKREVGGVNMSKAKKRTIEGKGRNDRVRHAAEADSRGRKRQAEALSQFPKVPRVGSEFLRR